MTTTAAFYQVVWSLIPPVTEPAKIVLEGDCFLLVIHGIPSEIAAHIQVATPPIQRSETALNIFLPVPRIEVARQQAQSLGGGIAGQSAVWSTATCRACDGCDPEGNVFQIREALM